MQYVDEEGATASKDGGHDVGYARVDFAQIAHLEAILSTEHRLVEGATDDAGCAVAIKDGAAEQKPRLGVQRADSADEPWAEVRTAGVAGLRVRVRIRVRVRPVPRAGAGRGRLGSAAPRRR